MRITERTRIQAPGARIEALRIRQASVQEKVSTGRRVNRPSDDPVATLRISVIQTRERQVEQFDRNLGRGDASLLQADSALGEAIDGLHRIRELTIQSASAALTPEDANSIAAEVATLRDHLISLANTRIGDRYLFGGFRDNQAAYDAAGAFQGDTNQATLEVGDRQFLAVAPAGGAAFGDGTAATVDVFTMLQNLVTQIPIRNVAGFDNIETELANLELATSQVIAARSSVGGALAQLSASRNVNVLMQERLPTERSNLQDAEMTSAISELQLVDTALQTTLAVTGRTINGPTLLDFLR